MNEQKGVVNGSHFLNDTNLQGLGWVGSFVLSSCVFISHWKLSWDVWESLLSIKCLTTKPYTAMQKHMFASR